MAKERIDTYPEAARCIALYLGEFCDRSLRYPEMIAGAARAASKEIAILRCSDSVQPTEQEPCPVCEQNKEDRFCGYCGRDLRGPGF